MPEPKLTQFLRNLTTSRAARRRFREDPFGMMKAAGLSKAHQSLIRSRRLAPLSQAVHAEHTAVTEPIVCVIIVDAMRTFWKIDPVTSARKVGRRTAGASGKTKKAAKRQQHAVGKR
jgi:hypothetical protein